MIPSIHLGPLTIQTFGLSVAIAFLCSGAVLMRRFRELGWDPDWAYEATGAALVGGIVGARLWWVLSDPSAFGDDPVGRLFGGSGLTWYGGAIGGTLAVWGWTAWRRLPAWQMAAAAVPALALGYALGRIGCQISGDGDYGIPSDVPWAMAYPDGVVPTDQAVHPTPIYETLWMGLVALMLWHLRDRVAAPVLVGAYLLSSGIERFVVEFWRRNPTVDGTITLAQITALVSVAIGIGVLVIAQRGDARARPLT